MVVPNEEPLIVGFVADLMFQVRIEEAASQLGYHVRWIQSEAELAPAMGDGSVPQRQLGEHLLGPGYYQYSV
jgi:hypothetical protein